MNNDMNGGVSKRSLLLLGGLAALSLNPDLRRKLVLGTRDALGTAQGALDDTIKPALAGAAVQAGHAGHVAQAAAQSAVQTAMHTATHTLETLREEVPPRAHALLGSAQEAAGVLAAGAAAKAVQLRHDAGEAAQVAREEAGKRLTTLSGEVAEATADRREAASKALTAAQTTGKTVGSALIADVSHRVQGLLGDAQDTVEGRRHAAEKALARARKDAEKELRAARKEWKPKKLESAVAKRIAPLHKQVERELAQFEKELNKKNKQAARGGRQIEGKMKKEVAVKTVKVKAARAKARKEMESERGSNTSGVIGLVLLATGAIVLARIPVARQGILNAVESINPGAAQSLKNAGRSARNLIGTMWLERMEEEPKPATPPAAAAPAPSTAAAAVAPAAGAAANTQAATTGATWGGAIAPDSPAAGNTSKPSGTDANKTN